MKKHNNCTCSNSSYNNTSYISAKKSDPTLTATLRRMFVNQFVTRYRAITTASNESIVKNNCFGYSDGEYANYMTAQRVIVPNQWKSHVFPIQERRYQFASSSEKMAGYMDWLKDMEKASIFQLVRMQSVSTDVEPIWANLYIQSAYKKGILSARRNIRKDPEVLESIGRTKNEIGVTNEDISAAFNQPVHADRVATLYTRTYNDLIGINGAMDAEISRILAQGLVQGDSPRVLAKAIATRISAIGIHRATLLARTEIIRAHHLASIQEYRNAGIFGVSVLAEWSTAGDSRVCELCKALEGKVFTLDEIEYKIPLHPQCRCAAIPVVVEQTETEKLAS